MPHLMLPRVLERSPRDVADHQAFDDGESDLVEDDVVRPLGESVSDGIDIPSERGERRRSKSAGRC